MTRKFEAVHSQLVVPSNIFEIFLVCWQVALRQRFDRWKLRLSFPSGIFFTTLLPVVD